jgi:predicted enzyme related to lactoylglutathione lyase
MGTRSAHPPGAFSWVDLSANDAAAAKSFYGGLFGWGFEDLESEGGTYSMCRLDGSDVCAIVEQKDVPPHWNNYVTVADAGAAVAKARDLGATVIEDAFDVVDAGRMGLFSDPTGAMLCVWEPKQHIGAGIVNAPGALTWNELHTTDLGAASSFYDDLFGWSVDALDTGGGPAYSVIRNGGRANGGMMEAQAGEPPNWIPYFATDDLDGTITLAIDAGGELRGGPIPFPAGRIAAVEDPQGAAFALWQGELED